MNKQREALQIALDALIEVTGWQWAGPMRVIDEVEDAIAASREALAEPSRKPLTDEEIETCMKEAYATVRGRQLEHEFARAIERAHGIVKAKGEV